MAESKRPCEVNWKPYECRKFSNCRDWHKNVRVCFSCDCYWCTFENCPNAGVSKPASDDAMCLKRK